MGSLLADFHNRLLKPSNIKKLLELTGSGKLGVQVGQNMIRSFKNNHPNVPEVFWNDFLKELNSDVLINIIIPIYDKYYTDSDIKELTEFYQSPLGKKMTATMPQIAQESMQVGQVWGKEIGKKYLQT